MADTLFELARDIDRRCRVRGDFVLRSGAHAAEYFDKYLFESDPGLLRRVVDRMVALVPPGTDLLGGLELGGVPLATMLGALTGLPTLFVRKQAKDYGTRRLVEGGEPAGRTVLLVEDVVTTGGAVRSAAGVLRSAGAVVDAAVCAIDRSGTGSPLADVGIVLGAVLTKDLLDSVGTPL